MKRKVVSNLSMVVIDKPVTAKKNDDFKGAPPCLSYTSITKFSI